jgi:transposase
MSCLITMSQRELNRLKAVQKIRDRRLSVICAAEMLGLSRSQMHRLLQAYERDGARGRFLSPGAGELLVTRRMQAQ